MGVIGLWNLIEDSGTKVNVETLRGKVLAIDLSIWINQSIKGFRDKDGRAVENAHILGLFHRVCKLLFFNIRPIFVFDGDCPTLKSRTLAKRHERTRKSLAKSKNISLNVLEKYVSSQLGGDINSTTLLNATRNKLRLNEKSLLSELFLPPKSDSRQVDIYQEFVELNKQIRNSVDESDSDVEFEKNDKDIDDDPDASYHVPNEQNIRDIDFNSAHFKSLPATTRYEILVEMRESFKGRKNPFPEMLPSDSDIFSQYQMKKLLKKRILQEEIDKLIAELNDVNNDDNFELLKKSTNSDLINTAQKITGGRLASDESTRFLLFNKTSFIENKPPSEIDEINKVKCQIDDNDQLNIQNLAYSLPNSLSDSNFKSDFSRIEHLSQVSMSSTSASIQFQSKQLAGHLDKNVKKLSQTEAITKLESSNLILSDSDSSSDNEDFVEVEPVELESSQDNFVDDSNLFQESISLPYQTDYKLDICVNENNEKINTESTSLAPLTTSITLSQDTQQDKSSVDSMIVDSKSVVSFSDSENVAETTFQMTHKKQDEIERIEEEIEEILPIIDSCKQMPDQHVPTESISTNQTIKPVEEINVEELIEQTKESNKISRQAATVNRQMIDDCQELLRLFGIPWVVAPAEAEAQCAALEELGLCEGVITDDSDIFLFGGKRVFRNFFTNSKMITQFQVEDFQKYYGLDRSKLICLGMLCGTDYTLGIEGIGPVTGLELLSEFCGKDMQPLVKFADWYRSKLNSSAKNSKPENGIRAKLLKFVVPISFPSQVIFDAYKNANVDQSQVPFSWASPQLYELRRLAKSRFGWSEPKTDSILLPVLKNLNEKQVQTRIDFFFQTSSKNSAVTEKLKIKRSKRLNEAIRRNIQQTAKQDESNREGSTAKRRKRQPISGKVKPSSSNSTLVLSEESSSDSN